MKNENENENINDGDTNTSPDKTEQLIAKLREKVQSRATQYSLPLGDTVKPPIRVTRTVPPKKKKVKNRTAQEIINALLVGPEKSITFTQGRTARWDTITPEIARYILNHMNNRSVENRKISYAKVLEYCSDMKRGAWQATGEAIIFSEDGTLMNGQHRLLALIMAAVTIECVISCGVKNDVFGNIDGLKPRNHTDMFQAKLGKDPDYKDIHIPLIAPVMTLIYNYETNRPKYVTASKNPGYTSTVASITQDNHPETRDYLTRYAKKKNNGLIISDTLASFCYWGCATHGGQPIETVHKYLDEALTGMGLRPNTITCDVHNTLKKAVAAKHTHMDRTSIVSNVVLGWRRYIGLSKQTTNRFSVDKPMPRFGKD